MTRVACAEPAGVLDPDAVYLGDNGRVFCGALRCAGATAFATGRDLSGQRALRLTPEMVREAAWVPACEGCGREAGEATECPAAPRAATSPTARLPAADPSPGSRRERSGLQHAPWSTVRVGGPEFVVLHDRVRRALVRRVLAARGSRPSVSWTDGPGAGGGVPSWQDRAPNDRHPVRRSEPSTVSHDSTSNPRPSPTAALVGGDPRVGRLVGVIQELSLARDLATVQEIVRHAARELTGADGATFVLRDGDQCFYVDEDAIAPLWKGCRFPMSACISGWSMLNRQPAVIEDIYVDPRIPIDAYRPTFVKSLAMVPIRTLRPVGAIGNYWASQHRPSEAEVSLLQALADSTSIAIENVQLYADLERRVRDRTAELESAMRELEAFSYSVSHDLRNPLQAIMGFAELLSTNHAATLDARGKAYLHQISGASMQMSRLIEDLLRLARVGRAELRRDRVDLSALAREIVAALGRGDPLRRVDLVIEDGLVAAADAGLVRVALENLLGNAWKYTSRKEAARIELGSRERADGVRVFVVRDNGAGFDMAHAGELFVAFKRLHGSNEFPGTGIGLATVALVVQRHGGTIEASARVGEGASFEFTLGGDAAQAELQA